MISKLRHGEEITERKINEVIDAVNANRVESPNLLLERTTAGTTLAMPRAVETEPITPGDRLRAFELLEVTIPGRIEGGGGSSSPPDGAPAPDYTVKGFFLDDSDETPVEFWPVSDSSVVEALAFGVGRPGSYYYQGMIGWARWVEDMGQWQIVAMNASTIVDATALGPWTLIDSDTGGATETLTVAENLVGLISAGNTIRVQGATLANNRTYTVVDVAWTAPDTLITVAELVGGNNEVTGTVGRIILPDERAVARLHWIDEDAAAGYLIDSQYDLELVNLTNQLIAAGTALTLHFDRQSYTWRVLDIKTPSLFTGHLLGIGGDAPDHVVPQAGNYDIVWQRDELNGGNLEHFHPDKDIELSSPGWYEVTFSPSFIPNVGNRASFQVDFTLTGIGVIFTKRVFWEGIAAWTCCTGLSLTHVFNSPVGGAEIYITITELNVAALTLRGNAAMAQPRCSIAVKRLRD